MITTTHFDVQISNTYSGWAKVGKGDLAERISLPCGGVAAPRYRTEAGIPINRTFCPRHVRLWGKLRIELLLSDEASQFGER
jgi:hypothetical protein